MSNIKAIGHFRASRPATDCGFTGQYIMAFGRIYGRPVGRKTDPYADQILSFHTGQGFLTLPGESCAQALERKATEYLSECAE